MDIARGSVCDRRRVVHIYPAQPTKACRRDGRRSARTSPNPLSDSDSQTANQSPHTLIYTNIDLRQCSFERFTLAPMPPGEVDAAGVAERRGEARPPCPSWPCRLLAATPRAHPAESPPLPRAGSNCAGWAARSTRRGCRRTVHGIVRADSDSALKDIFSRGSLAGGLTVREVKLTLALRRRLRHATPKLGTWQT
jgi:hypothetical protein